ncbi:MAG: pectinesterase family protein [Opitutus sp.]
MITAQGGGTTSVSSVNAPPTASSEYLLHPADRCHRTPSWIFALASLAIALIACVSTSARAEFPKIDPDAIVAVDGSGQYTSLQEAISAAPMNTDPGAPPWIIFVKRGRYKERIYVQRERGNLHVVGEDAENTLIVYDLNAGMAGPDGKPIGTFRTPTVQIDGDGMIWENVTIANAAGPVGQALALRADGDQLVFRHCRFLGWQDTLLLNRGRHYFADCYVEGHVDFIFGAATAYFDRCEIRVLRDGYITAASTPKDQPYGFVFADCKITGAPGVKAFLGRPWRDFAKTIFLRTQMDEVVRPEGWDNWKKTLAERTSFYAEAATTGSGASPSTRVSWAKPLTPQAMAAITPATVLGGNDAWDAASVPRRIESQMIRDVVYREVDGAKVLLDASVPTGKGPYPVAILVHGGGWTRGDKNGLDEPTKGADITPWFGPLTAAKFTWFSINYRHAPQHRWPACFDDVQAAIRWVKAHAAEYKGDPKRIALFGHSAGGQLVCLAATLADETTRVQAVVGFAPVTDFEQELPVRGGLSPSLQALHNRPKEVTPEALKILQETSPITHVKHGLPPFLLLHGDADKTVPYQQSLNFQAHLRANKVPCELITIKGAPHGLLTWSNFSPDYADRMMAWLQKTLAPPAVR